MNRWVILFFVFSATNNCGTLHPMKEWVNDKMNTDVSENWNNELSVDGLSFPTSADIPFAFEDEEQNRCRIVFPMDGDSDGQNKIVTSTTASSGIDDRSTKSQTCLNQEKLGVPDALWIDPRNWKSKTTNRATPHAERIPCVNDGVNFKNTDHLLVKLPALGVTVDHILFGSMLLRAERFNSTINAEDFMRHFVVPGKRELKDLLKVKNSSTVTTGCDNQTGCECGTSHFFNDICHLVKGDECVKELQCSQPLQPVGHCCPICGAFITVGIDAGTFVFAKLQAFVQSHLDTFNKKKISAHVSKTSPLNIQIVLVGNEGAENDTYDVASQLVQLLTESNLNATLGIQRVIFQYSDPLPDDTKTWTSFARATYTVIFMSLGVGIFYAMFNSRRLIRKFSSIFKKSSTVKFENRSGRISIGDSNTDADRRPSDKELNGKD